MRFIFLILSIVFSNVLNNYYRYKKSHSKRRYNLPDYNEADSVSKNTIYIQWHPDERRRKRNENRYNWIKEVPGCFTLFVAFISVIVSVRAYWEARNATIATVRQAVAAENQLALAYPPTFHVINPVAYKSDSNMNTVPDIIKGSRVSGWIQILAVGREPSYISAVRCAIYWGSSENLPMIRPYLPESTATKIPCGTPVYDAPKEKTFVYESPVDPGNVIRLPFQTTVPDEKMSLYIMGAVFFRDRLTPNRYSLFAVRYDSGLRRFVKVKDPDYEREDEQALDDKTP